MQLDRDEGSIILSQLERMVEKELASETATNSFFFGRSGVENEVPERETMKGKKGKRITWVYLLL